MSIPFIIIFTISLLFSTLFLVSSTHWLLIWAIFEINLLSFIPLISASQNNQETESSLNYFFAQAVGSSTIVTLAFTLFLSPTQIILSTPIIYTTIILSILLKLGVGPLHFWFPSVISGLNWPLALILSTWQNIGPLIVIILINTTHNINLLLIIGSLSAIVGGLGGINQTDLRALLAYSSIGHLGWMCAVIGLSINIAATYYFIYCLIIIPIFITIWNINIINTSFSTNTFDNESLFWLILMLLSLGGIPPLIGFFPNWLIFINIIETNLWLILSLLIAGALINIYYYISIMFAAFYSNTSNNNNSTQATTTSLTSASIMLSTTGAILTPIMLMIL